MIMCLIFMSFNNKSVFDPPGNSNEERVKESNNIFEDQNNELP